MFNLSPSKPNTASYIAAIDLGSNSFHLIIARWDKDQLVLLDRLREPVRLGWGLNADGSLDAEYQERALQCFKKFGELLRKYPSANVRIVGTKTLRSLKNAQDFLKEAQNRLGHRIEIISGDEEARLIYSGVAHCIAPDDGLRLVMDIGGGSTEIILGKGMQPLLKESLNMGCVAITKRFFFENNSASQTITAKKCDQALIACLQELEPVAENFLTYHRTHKLADDKWQSVLGASGTIKAVSKVCEAMGWSQGTINIGHLERIIQQYISQGNLDVKFSGLSEDRQAVFLGGVIVLKALFIALHLEQLEAADWALREGLLYDLKGRLENKDIRQSSVVTLAERFHVNQEKAKAVEKTAQRLLHLVARDWKLHEAEANKLLGWAAHLATLGLDIAHSDYHKHSAYIVQHVDMAGFSRVEQSQIACLVLAHRKRFPLAEFGNDRELIRAAILLRIAMIFHRGKTLSNFPEMFVEARGKALSIYLPKTFFEQNPLTIADLETEANYLADIDYRLNLLPI